MSEEQSIYDRLTTPTSWPNPAPFVSHEAAVRASRRAHGEPEDGPVRSGETQWAGKYDDPDAKPDDERWEPGEPISLKPGAINYLWTDEESAGLKDRILDAARADDEHDVIAKHLAVERAECEHVALFTLRDSLTEDGTTEEQVHTARLILLYLLETR